MPQQEYSQTFINLVILSFFAFSIYFIFNFVITNKEGLENSSDDTSSSIDNKKTSNSTSSKNGIAGNITQYLTSLQTKVVQYDDQMLISKYRSDYEKTILKLDDLINSLMLETALSVDSNNAMPMLSKLNTLNGAKISLNNVMKYIDSK
jgi:hypothetical protein